MTNCPLQRSAESSDEMGKWKYGGYHLEHLMSRLPPGLKGSQVLHGTQRYLFRDFSSCCVLILWNVLNQILWICSLVWLEQEMVLQIQHPQFLGVKLPLHCEWGFGVDSVCFVLHQQEGLNFEFEDKAERLCVLRKYKPPKRGKTGAYSRDILMNLSEMPYPRDILF